MYFKTYTCVLVVIFINRLAGGKFIEKGVSGEFKQLLDRIKPGFEENLIRAFKNEAVRNEGRAINNNRYLHKMSDIFLSLDDTKIELSNLIFPWIPDFRIINLSVDLNMLCLDVNFKLGNLKVEGNYEASNMTLQRVLPVTNNGTIEITFKEATASGRIGLLIKGDSFVPENYDIICEPTEAATTVKYFISNGSEVENQIIKPSGEDVIGDAIWQQINEILLTLLHRQLGEVVVEVSVTELLEDEDAQLRDLAREHSQRANKLLDSLLCSSKDYLVAKDYRRIEIPPFNISYRGKLSVGFQGKLRTGVGYIQDLSTLSRLQDLSFYEDQYKLVVYGSLSLREFKHGYDYYSSELETTQISGNIKATAYRNKICIKLTVLKEGRSCKTQLDTVHVSTVSDIDVDVSGLASLSWLGPKMEAWVIGNLRQDALPVLEKYIKEAFTYAIEKTDCIALLVG